MVTELGLGGLLVLGLAACSGSHQAFCKGNVLHSFTQCGSCPPMPFASEWSDHPRDCGRERTCRELEGGGAACVNEAAPVCDAASPDPARHPLRSYCDGPSQVMQQSCIGGHMERPYPGQTCRAKDEKCFAVGDRAECVFDRGEPCVAQPGRKLESRCNEDGSTIYRVGCSDFGFLVVKDEERCAGEGERCMAKDGAVGCAAFPPEPCEPDAHEVLRAACSADRRSYTMRVCAPIGYYRDYTLTCAPGAECVMVGVAAKCSSPVKP